MNNGAKTGGDNTFDGGSGMSDASGWTIPEPHAVFEVRASDGALIFVRRHGNPHGPRIVLSHGNGFSADAYLPFWSHFLDLFDVFVHDVRNHGRNPVGERRVHNVPTFAEDSNRVVHAIDRRFGVKPRAGIFHSLSAIVALRQAATGGGGFAALVLFDPPVCPPGGFPTDMLGIGERLARIARMRRARYASPRAYAEHLSQNRAFRHLPRDSLDLFARTTLRPTADGTDYELCCPREYEAQINEYFFVWSIMVDFEGVTCPMKAIGADPTVSGTYMPSMDIHTLGLVDYDFVPETSHLLLLEQPARCADLTIEFLSRHGFR